mmetsp:Transcript_17714/g.54038  ORF Transcript_17714/g.54038 Transcript_17714/m.54038 type:complete len:256 (-) Transcript_17714:892-1659(-)
MLYHHHHPAAFEFETTTSAPPHHAQLNPFGPTTTTTLTLGGGGLNLNTTASRRSGKRTRRGGRGRNRRRGRKAALCSPSGLPLFNQLGQVGHAFPWWYHHMARSGLTPEGVAPTAEDGFPVILPSAQCVYILPTAKNPHRASTYASHGHSQQPPPPTGPPPANLSPFGLPRQSGTSTAFSSSGSSRQTEKTTPFPCQPPPPPPPPLTGVQCSWSRRTRPMATQPTRKQARTTSLKAKDLGWSLSTKLWAPTLVAR